jgi:hypothetical protein
VAGVNRCSDDGAVTDLDGPTWSSHKTLAPEGDVLGNPRSSLRHSQ